MFTWLKNQIFLAAFAFRTADAFSLEKIYLAGITATPPHREIHKTALGAEDTVEWERAAAVRPLLERLKAEGYIVLAIEQTDSSIALQDFDICAEKKYALVFGNEVTGVSETALDLADHAIEVPQTGTKHSLNISVCLGILSWRFFEKLYLSL